MLKNTNILFYKLSRIIVACFMIYISVAMMSAAPRDVVIDMGDGMLSISRQVW